jgi:hypothetical protein
MSVDPAFSFESSVALVERISADSATTGAPDADFGANFPFIGGARVHRNNLGLAASGRSHGDSRIASILGEKCRSHWRQ